MTFYALSTFAVGSVTLLLFLLMANVVAHAWAIRCLLGYRFVLGSSALWRGLALFIVFSAVGLAMRMCIIFTDQIPPLRVVDVLEYGAHLGLVILVSVWLDRQRIKNEEPHVHKRRAGDQL